MTPRRFFTPAVFFLAATLLAACDRSRPAADDDPTPEADRFGGTAVVAGILDLQSMNALASSETFARMFQRDVLFMSLLRYDEELEPIPWLAESWDTVRVAPDSLQLTFRLRDDVRWHDGTPTTAEDVRFTFDRARDPAVGSPLASGFARYAPAPTLEGGRTIRFRLQAHSEFLDVWVATPIMPSHILASVPPAELARHPFGSEQPVGNGPFRFLRRVPGQEWVFEANPDFPAALGGRPYLDRLVYRLIPDQTTLLTETLVGGVDVYLSVNPAQAQPLEASSDVDLRSAPSPFWTFIAWNTRLPMFDTPAERRALTMALDRRQMVEAILGPHGEVGRSVLTPSHWAFTADDRSAALPFDRDEARRLLAAAGWVDRNGDGILQDSAGRPFRFSLTTPQGNDARRDLMQIVQAQLREIGVDARPAVVEGNTLIAQISGTLDAAGDRHRDFDAVVMGWGDGFRKDDSNLFHSRNLQGPFNISGFGHPRADALLDTLGVIVDRRQAEPLWREYQALLAQEAPYTVIYYPHRLTAVRARLRGMESDVRGDMVNVTRWFIPPQLR